MTLRHNPFQIGLTDLVSAPRTAATELDTVFAHPDHQTVHEFMIGIIHHEIEGIITHALQCEIGFEMTAIDPV